MIAPKIFRLLLAAVAGWIPWPCFGVEGEKPMDVERFLPDRHGSWVAAGPAAIYDTTGIFRYMNGAGEVYRSFDFRRLAVREYEGPGGAGIVAETYDMGNPGDAFGVFARNRRGGNAGVGQGSEYHSGYLVFWKDRFFAAVFAKGAGEPVREEVIALGRAVAERIPGEGVLPEILTVLPPDGLAPHSTRYFHEHTDLNEHYFLSDDDILGLGPGTDAALGAYGDGSPPLLLVVIAYPEEEDAEKGEAEIRRTFFGGAGEGPIALEDGTWATAERSGRHLLLVFDAPGFQEATEIVDAARRRLKGEDR